MIEIYEKQQKIITELAELLRELVYELSQYREVEKEEEIIKTIERRRDGLEACGRDTGREAPGI